MTGYLRTLAARALGQRSNIRPHTWRHDLWEPLSVAAPMPLLEELVSQTGNGRDSSAEHRMLIRSDAPPRPPQEAAGARRVTSPTDRIAAVDSANVADPPVYPAPRPVPNRFEIASDAADEATPAKAQHGRPSQTGKETLTEWHADPGSDERADLIDGERSQRLGAAQRIDGRRPHHQASDPTQNDRMRTPWEQHEAVGLHDSAVNSDGLISDSHVPKTSPRLAGAHTIADIKPSAADHPRKQPIRSERSYASPPSLKTCASVVSPEQAKADAASSSTRRPARKEPGEPEATPRQDSVEGIVRADRVAAAARTDEQAAGPRPGRLPTPGQSTTTFARLRPARSSAPAQQIGASAVPTSARAATPSPISTHRAAPAQESTSANVAPTSLPDVHIHIGRVELSAIHAPAVATRERAAAVKTMTLTDYLNRRNGNGRGS